MVGSRGPEAGAGVGCAGDVGDGVCGGAEPGSVDVVAIGTAAAVDDRWGYWHRAEGGGWRGGAGRRRF